MTCSYDGTLFYKSVNNEFPSSRFDHRDLKDEFECCTVVTEDDAFKDYKITKYMVGTLEGKLLMFEPGFWSTNTTTVN